MVVSSSSGVLTDLPPSFTVEGTVVDENGVPIEGAMVLQGGRPETLLFSNADGSFSIELDYLGYGIPGVTAITEEHRAAGTEFHTLPDGPVELVLHKAHAPDNPNYGYLKPGDAESPSTEFCGHCHNTFAGEFQSSKHAEATRDPLVQDLYAGVTQAQNDEGSCIAAGGRWQQGLVPGTASDPIHKCYVGGVLPDLNESCGASGQPACDDPAIAAAAKPTAFGACADCHAPGINGVAGGRNLHDAVETAFDNGVHCDVCHKVKDIDLDLPPGVGQRLILQRPQEAPPSPLYQYRPLYYGPLLDVPNGIMSPIYQPKFKQAQFCAGCHEQKQAALLPGDVLDSDRWPDGLPVHSTYSEWLAGPYNDPDTPCQFCHMPPNFDLVNTVDTATVENQSITFGYPRPPEDIRQHIFRSPLWHGEPRLIDGALYVSIDLDFEAGVSPTPPNPGTLAASISLANIGCGHAIPTGEPMRSLILLTQIEGVGCSEPAAASAGMTVNDSGGARAQGTEGSDVTTSGSLMTWPAGAAAAQSGHVVRAVRPSGSYDDYEGVGFFAEPSLSPADKGLEILDPIGTANVVSVAGDAITLDVPLSLQAGDIVYLGDPLPAALSDGDTSLDLAGASGHTFARVMVDSAGSRGTAHYRAVDIASDNRIPPGKNALTNHSFTVPETCTSVTVRATVLYRPVPTAMAALRGWEANDYVIATAEQTTAIP